MTDGKAEDPPAQDAPSSTRKAGMRLPELPVAWATVIVFFLVALASRDFLLGMAVMMLIVPVVLLVQIVIRLVFGWFRSPVWLRRSVMLAPALVFAGWVFWETNDFGLGGRQTEAIRIALAGQMPTGLRDVHVKEDAWTDYVVFAYFRCDPESLRRILEKEPFVRDDYQGAGFSFDQTGFEDLKGRPDVADAIGFSRNDLEDVKGSCRVVTDRNFSFAWIMYGVD